MLGGAVLVVVAVGGLGVGLRRLLRGLLGRGGRVVVVAAGAPGPRVAAGLVAAVVVVVVTLPLTLAGVEVALVAGRGVDQLAAGAVAALAESGTGKQIVKSGKCEFVSKVVWEFGKLAAERNSDLWNGRKDRRGRGDGANLHLLRR